MTIFQVSYGILRMLPEECEGPSCLVNQLYPPMNLTAPADPAKRTLFIVSITAWALQESHL